MFLEYLTVFAAIVISSELRQTRLESASFASCQCHGENEPVYKPSFSCFSFPAIVIIAIEAQTCMSLQIEDAGF